MNKEQYVQEVDALKASDLLKAKIQQQAFEKPGKSKKWIPFAACAAALLVIAVPALMSMQRMGSRDNAAAEVNYDTAEQGAYGYKADSEATDEDYPVAADDSVAYEYVTLEKTFGEIADYYELNFTNSALPYQLHIVEKAYQFSFYGDEIADDSVEILLKNTKQTVTIRLARVGAIDCYPMEESLVGTIDGAAIYAYTDENGKTAHRVDISDETVTEIVTLHGFSFDEIETVLNAIT